MILLSGGKTDIRVSHNFNMAPGATVHAEGMAMVRELINGEEVVKPSEGEADEVFAGFTYGEVFTPNVLSYVGQVTVSGGKALLPEGVIASQLLLKDGATELAVGDPATTAGKYSIAANLVTFHADQEGKVIDVVCRRNITTEELLSGGYPVQLTTASATDQIGVVGIIERGTVYTDMFDAAVDWTSASEVRLAAGGLFTDQTGAANAITGMQVVHVPTAEQPFLGLRLL